MSETVKTGQQFLDRLVGKSLIIYLREDFGSFNSKEFIGELLWHDRWHVCVDTGGKAAKQVLFYKHAIQRLESTA